MDKEEYLKLKNDPLFLEAHTHKEWKEFEAWAMWEIKNREYELKILECVLTINR